VTTVFYFPLENQLKPNYTGGLFDQTILQHVLGTKCDGNVSFFMYTLLLHHGEYVARGLWVRGFTHTLWLKINHLYSTILTA